MIILTVITLSIIHDAKKIEESFTYFPADRNAFFHSADTSLTLMEDSEKGYEVSWRTSSVLDRKAYLRQDISFLFENGLLKEKMGKKWKQQTDRISQKETILANESSNFKTISFHHAEIHGDNKITSRQKMTHDDLYVLDSKYSPLHSFRKPIHRQEKEWKAVIDQFIGNRINHALVSAQKIYPFKPDLYTIIPLTEIYQYEESPITGFTIEETEVILGKLWEGLYKNYFLGIKKEDGTILDPVGSTIPLILISNDKSHILVLSELKNGEIMILKQLLPNQ